MTDLELLVGGVSVKPAADANLSWVDRAQGLARIRSGGQSRLVVVEGAGTEWWVTIDGRRVPVTARSWRERILAEAEVAARTHAGPIRIAATLPGLVVAIAVGIGDEVEEGQSLLTIEAMKMQNEVRAPRAGVVAELAVTVGTAVATGALLLRIDEAGAPEG